MAVKAHLPSLPLSLSWLLSVDIVSCLQWQHNLVLTCCSNCWRFFSASCPLVLCLFFFLFVRKTLTLRLVPRLPLQHSFWHGVRKDLRRADFGFVLLLRWPLAPSHGPSQQRGQRLDTCRGQQQGVHSGYYHTNTIKPPPCPPSPVFVVSGVVMRACVIDEGSLKDTCLATFSSTIDLESLRLEFFATVHSAERRRWWRCRGILVFCFWWIRNHPVRRLFSCTHWLRLSQVDLHFLKVLTGIATQGAISKETQKSYYVTTFKLEVSTNGEDWMMYRHGKNHKVSKAKEPFRHGPRTASETDEPLAFAMRTRLGENLKCECFTLRTNV